MGIRKFIFFALLFVTGASRAIASSGTEGASFLDIPVGAGPAAMGSAYAALASNAYAPTINPGGLGFLKGPELAGEHLSYLQGIRYEHFSFVMPVGGSPSAVGGQPQTATRGIGISIQDLGTGDIARTDVANGAPVTGLGNFSGHWGAYNLSYGQTVTEKLAIGVTGKVIHASMDDVSANAYAFDAGGLYQYNERLSLAATAANVGHKLTFLNGGDSLPTAFHAGAAYKAGPRWMVTGEGVYRKTGLASVQMGAQWQPIETLSLRAGYRTDASKALGALAGFTTGIGLQIWGQELAYAWAPYGELGNAQYFSLVMRFGAAKDARRNLILAPVPQERRLAQAGAPGSLMLEDPQFVRLLQDKTVER